MKKAVVLVAAVAFMSGCATRGANYVPLVDMKNKDQAQFDVDVRECQAYANQRMDAQKGAVAGAILGALLGAALAPRGYRSQVAGQGAVIGGVAGAGGANQTQEGITKQCLAGRGYNVLN